MSASGQAFYWIRIQTFCWYSDPDFLLIFGSSLFLLNSDPDFCWIRIQPFFWIRIQPFLLHPDPAFFVESGSGSRSFRHGSPHWVRRLPSYAHFFIFFLLERRQNQHQWRKLHWENCHHRRNQGTFLITPFSSIFLTIKPSIFESSRKKFFWFQNDVLIPCL